MRRRSICSTFPGERDRDRCELLIKRGEAEREAGDLRFRTTLLEAAQIARGIGDQDMLVRATLANNRGMQSETGVVDQGRMATLDSALAIVGHDDSSARARLLAIQAAELMYSEEWEHRLRLSDEALTIARRLDDVHALSGVLNLRFVTLLAPGTLSERQAMPPRGGRRRAREQPPGALLRLPLANICVHRGRGDPRRAVLGRTRAGHR